MFYISRVCIALPNMHSPIFERSVPTVDVTIDYCYLGGFFMMNARCMSLSRSGSLRSALKLFLLRRSEIIFFGFTDSRN